MAIATLTVKLQAQIAEFQSEFREATRSAEKFRDSFEGIATRAVAIGNLIARGFETVGRAIGDHIQHVVETASRVDDLSKKLGVSTGAIQRWSFAAEQSGGSIATVDRALAFMNQTLAEGNKSTIAALEQAGLSFENIRTMRPEDAFNAIATAIGEIPDPMTRAQVAMKLFGRTGQDLLPGIVDGSFKAAESIKVMSDETVKRLADAEDAWGRFSNILTIHTGEFLGRTLAIAEGWIATVDRMTNSWKKFAETVQILTAGSLTGFTGTIDALRQIDALQKAAQSGGGAGQTGQSSQAVRDTLKAFEELTGAQARGKGVVDQYRESVRQLSRELSGAKLQGDVKKLNDAFKLLTAEQRQSDEVMRRVADAALDLFHAGATLTPELFNVVIETGKLSELLPPVKLGLDGAALGFEAVTGSVKESAANLSEFISLLNDPRLSGVEGIPRDLPGFVIPPPQIPEPLPPTFWQEFLGVEGPSFQQSARFAADSVVGALANAITTGDWGTFKARLRDTFVQFVGSALAAGVNAIVPGLGTLLQPLFTALADKFVGLFDRNRGRDLVEDFAQSLGGFDALHQKLNELGAEGERLWIKLTQGVGRNNPEQARRAIEAVTAALEEQKRKQQEAGKASEEAAQKIRDSQDAATAALKGRISELQSEYDRLWNTIKDEAPEEVMGVVEQQTRARMEAVREEQVKTQQALEEVIASLEDSFGAMAQAAVDAAKVIQEAFSAIRMPTFRDDLPPIQGGVVSPVAMASGGIVRRPTLALVGESGPEAVVPLSQFGGAEPQTATIILEMDARQVAEAVVPVIPSVIRRYGLV